MLVREPTHVIVEKSINTFFVSENNRFDASAQYAVRRVRYYRPVSREISEAAASEQLPMGSISRLRPASLKA